jgi:hypothetical protein
MISHVGLLVRFDDEDLALRTKRSSNDRCTAMTFAKQLRALPDKHRLVVALCVITARGPYRSNKW